MDFAIYHDLIVRGCAVPYTKNSKYVYASADARSVIRDFVDNKCTSLHQRAKIKGVVEKIAGKLATSPETGRNEYKTKKRFFPINAAAPSYLKSHDTRWLSWLTKCGQFRVCSLYRPKLIDDHDHIVWEKSLVEIISTPSTPSPLPLY